MTKRRRLWLTLLVLGVLGTGLALWQHLKGAGDIAQQSVDEPRNAPTRERERSHQHSLGAQTSAALPSGQVMSNPPLPVPGSPLLEIKDDLLERLAQGDARAGCRLYRELRRCWNYASYSQTVDNMINHAVVRDVDDEHVQEVAESISQLETRLESSAKVCEGVAAEQFDTYFDVVRRTAELGEPLAMVEFAENGGFLLMEFARFPDRLILWHQLAPDMIERALHMGTPEAAFSLHSARSQNVGLLGALLPNDPVEAHAMSLLLDKVLTANWNPPSTWLNPQQLREAEERANSLYMQHFANRGTLPALRLMRDPLEADIEYCEAAE